MVENNGLSTGKIIGGVTGKGFKRGQSGNPGGRPRGLGEKARQATKEGQDLIQFYKMAFKAEGSFSKLDFSDREIAARWLADRGFGKVNQDAVQIDVAMNFIGKISNIINNVLPDTCPNCKNLNGFREDLIRGLETLTINNE